MIQHKSLILFHIVHCLSLMQPNSTEQGRAHDSYPYQYLPIIIVQEMRTISKSLDFRKLNWV